MSQKKIIQKNTKVTVANTLNQMIFEQRDMNLQMFRMIMFYIAKINPANPQKREVMIELEKYAEMLGVELNEKVIDEYTKVLFNYSVKFGEYDNGEYIVKNTDRHFFQECCLMKRKSDGKEFLSFKCSEDVIPLLFQLKEKFTVFSVWNVLNLNSFQDIRLYMLLSQHKNIGAKIMTIEELKAALGIETTSYPEYKEFARTVLKKCQRALKERTDIQFDFQSVGRPAHSVRFIISANTEYTMLKYLQSETEIAQNSDGLTLEEQAEQREEICLGFEDSIFDEFTAEQLEELRALAWDNVDPVEVDKQNAVLHDITAAKEYAVAKYVTEKILMCNARADRVKHRYAYIRRAVKDNYK